MSWLLCLLLSATPASAGALLEEGKAALVGGAFEAAVSTLTRAANAAQGDGPLLAQIYLLRGQAHSALSDFGGVEADFARALQHNPDARLDPAKVHPTVVTLLEELRGRLEGTLVVAGREGALLFFDGRPLGTSPLTVAVRIGTHVLEARPVEGGPPLQQRIQVRVNAQERVELPAAATGADRLSWRFDARAVIDLRGGLGGELGAGLGGPWWSLSLQLHAGSVWGTSLRAALVAPEWVPHLRPYAAVDGDLFFSGTPVLGVGGTVGTFVAFSPRWEPFLELTARLLGAPEGLRAQYLLLGVGVRLRL